MRGKMRMYEIIMNSVDDTERFA
ncbi:tRNA (adenosine(37)-N6)-threonylcarbamoyltransferase complex ATPase subunit type 1 TsaE, partial [Clostridioides difficile]|nr:tRNA (adenosine(37)-N6)-threonylcarbamoyltransferase complex ATPase subunit type 1 TsaE [Clostridioides difficile]